MPKDIYLFLKDISSFPLFSGEFPIETMYLPVFGRKLKIPIACGRVARFSFDELCNQVYAIMFHFKALLYVRKNISLARPGAER